MACMVSTEFSCPNSELWEPWLAHCQAGSLYFRYEMSPKAHVLKPWLILMNLSLNVFYLFVRFKVEAKLKVFGRK